MKKHDLRKIVFVLLTASLLATTAAAQKHKPKPVQKTPKQIVFAVLNDGRTLEPIGYVNKGKLQAPVNGSDDRNLITAFNKTYYKVGTAYTLIFAGANAGTVTVKSSDAKAECSSNMAEATTRSGKTSLKGLVMGLATNLPAKPAATAFRRKPTTAEKNLMDSLVRAEFLKQKLTPKDLHYQNLTALDVDNDGKPEFVGSYWIEIDKLTRGLLFFIAQKGSNGKYSIAYKEYRSVDQTGVMSGDINSVDQGVYHELLLDALDYDGDGTGEIFTYTQSFEGAGFNAYRRSGGKWTRAFDYANYHCGY